MTQFVLVALVSIHSLQEHASADQAIALPRPVTVAMMDFESKAPGNADFGRQIAEVLTVRLSLMDTVVAVERQKLKDLLAEQKLRLAGLSTSEQATQVGKLLGAEIVIFGQAFPVGDELYVALKLVAVETGQIKGAVVHSAMTEPLSVVLDRASEELNSALTKHMRELVPRPAAEVDPVEALRSRLGERNRPVVAVMIPESHVSQRIPDPAAETEITRLLIRLGCEVRAVKDEATQQWARNLKDSKAAWPESLKGVQIVITGEAFSERASSFEGLVSCSARLEVSVVERAAGTILEADRTTERAVDLSEHIAAKSALQRCGHVVGLRLADLIARRAMEKSP